MSHKGSSERTWEERIAFAQTALLLEGQVRNGSPVPTWIDDECFWYCHDLHGGGVEYRVIRAEDGAALLTVSRGSVAGLLARCLESEVDQSELILFDIAFDLAAERMEFTAFGSRYSLSVNGGCLEQRPADRPRQGIAASAGALAFLRDHNLWVVEGDAERALTRDGDEFFAYADVPYSGRGLRAMLNDASPEALWSPDGQWLFTVQTDDRSVPDNPFVEYVPEGFGRPRVHPNKTSLPIDARVTEFRLVLIEAETGRQREIRYPRLPAVRMGGTIFSAGLAWWAKDSRRAYFVDIERGEKAAHVVEIDVATGQTRKVFSELSETYVEVSANVYTPSFIRHLPATDELIWYSERSGRGHLYLYDLKTGGCKRAITKGEWQVREVLHVDIENRVVFVMAGGIVPDEMPYICKPVQISLDEDDLRVLSDAKGHHHVWVPDEMALMLKRLEGFDPKKISGFSPSGKYFIEIVSGIDAMPETNLRTCQGDLVVVLARADAPLPSGWQDPMPIECLAADGATLLHGLLFKPFSYREDRKYPLIDLIYGGPQIEFTPYAGFASGHFNSRTFLDAVHLSAIGSFVLILDGRGTAAREAAFRTQSHGKVQYASNLDDHVHVIKTLAADRGDMDLSRVGLTGFSGGGYMAALGALRFGEFFKVSVAGGGNYDQALFWHSWGERFHGLFDEQLYAEQAARTYAKDLSGKLLLIHGLMDGGCHPSALFGLIQALIDADKDADLVLLPRVGHEWSAYGLKRRLVYLIEHLLGEPIPRVPQFENAIDRRRDRFVANQSVPLKKAGTGNLSELEEAIPAAEPADPPRSSRLSGGCQDGGTPS
ncbi:MAG: DPP IV N-terminal domain-containing protein [Gammaproteobacteria bacterium]